MIGEVRVGSPAHRAGLKSGDRVLAVDGVAIQKWSQLQKRISEAPGREIALKLQRPGVSNPVDLRLTPARIETEDFNGKQVEAGRVGITYGAASSKITILSP